MLSPRLLRRGRPLRLSTVERPGAVGGGRWSESSRTVAALLDSDRRGLEDVQPGLLRPGRKPGTGVAPVGFESSIFRWF